MADIAQLGIEILSDDIVKATRRLDKLENQSKQTERQSKKLGSSFGMLAGAAGVLASSLAVRQFVQTAGAFQSMAISLEVVTGSAEKATQAMDGIRAFAKDTPFQVSEITDAFIKLKALGIAPTEERLRSFGDTSSAMGKSLNQMIEAVADAATGEFERLKEFGIKARSEGDNVSFTFQGVTTTVKKNSEEITRYLEGIGKTKFAGAMSKQMDTINGKISTLGDSFDNLIVTFSDAGGGSAATGAFDFMIEAVDAITKGIKSLPGIFVSLFAEFDKMAAGISHSAQQLAVDIAHIWSTPEETKKATENLRAEYEERVKIANDAALGFIAAEEMKNAATGGADGITKAGATTKPAATEATFTNEDELEKLREKYATELQLLEEKTSAEQALIDEALIMGAISEEDHQQLLTDIAENYAKKRKAIAKDESKGREQAMGAMMNNLVNLMNSGSKKLFEVGKAAALAQATVDTWKGAQAAFADTPGPVWVKAAAGIAAGLIGLQRVSAINSTSFGGGGGGAGSGAANISSVTGGQPVTGQLPPPAELPQSQQQEKVVRYVVEGESAHSNSMRDFIKNLESTLVDMGSDTRIVLS